MNLKKYTDYGIRVLIYTGMKPNNELASIKEISETFTISKHHLGKIVYELSKLGLVDTVRGRNGGIQLAVPPEEINIGHTVRNLENDAVVVECFDKGTNQCVISPACNLKHVFSEALNAFFQVLDQYTLKDMIVNDKRLRELMGMR
ncbi:RrF2 family transcriptional regulator [Virgibacillus sp. JSM 102003]|uniref:RrF2 family transcriptional regulator n=1 Tax=Virgibacillus sp. JSM 102003 TaxID=1562108 RepID=UPI0035C10E08